MLSEIRQIIDSLPNFPKNTGHYSRKGPSLKVDCATPHSAQWAAIILSAATAVLRSKSPDKDYKVSRGSWKEGAGHQIIIEKPHTSDVDLETVKDLKETVRAIFEDLSVGWSDSHSTEAVQYRNDWVKSDWAKSMDEPDKLVVISHKLPKDLQEADVLLTQLAIQNGLYNQKLEAQKIHVAINRGGTEIFVVGQRVHLNYLISAICKEALH